MQGLTTTARTGGERIAALDGLRGLACLMVFAVHFGQISGVTGSFGPFDLQRLMANGNVGVALFFTLSGYLLSLPFWESCTPGAARVAIGGYLARRAARIVPAYYLCLTALVLKNQLWREPGGWTDIGLHYLMLLNLGDRAIFSVNPPFWTIAVEAQFYLLLPLLFVAPARMRLRYRLAAVAALGLASYVAYALAGNALLSGAAMAGSAAIASGAQSTALPPSFTYSLVGHLPHFLFGVLAAGWHERLRDAARSSPLFADLACWGALSAVLIVLATALDEIVRVPWGRYNLPYVPLLLLAIVVAVPHAPIARRLFDGRAMRALGLISYGVYVYHLPILNVLARTMPKFALDAGSNWLVFGAVGLVVTLAVAALSHRFLERPIVRGVRRWSARVKVPAPSSPRRPAG
ncbi:MAG: acyltransferase [Burkholderiaceae bacterium]|nr:acyltransferase [Burkholderiaceae bacterium]